MEYSLKFNLEQNDFDRYVFHSALFNDDVIEKASVVLKTELFMFMHQTLGNISGVINVHILHDERYDVYAVLNMDKSDVYFICRYHNNHDVWQALLMLGENNSNHLDKLEIDNEVFNKTINKPVKYLLLACYPMLHEFLKSNVEFLRNASNTITSFIKTYDDTLANLDNETSEEVTEEISNQ